MSSYRGAASIIANAHQNSHQVPRLQKAYLFQTVVLVDSKINGGERDFLAAAAAGALPRGVLADPGEPLLEVADLTVLRDSKGKIIGLPLLEEMLATGAAAADAGDTDKETSNS